MNNEDTKVAKNAALQTLFLVLETRVEVLQIRVTKISSEGDTSARQHMDFKSKRL
jgi:hypothetical protein